MFSKIDETAPEDLLIPRPTVSEDERARDAEGYMTVEIKLSDGEHTMNIYSEDITHWLRVGVERGTETNPLDYTPMNHTFSLHIDSNPENEPVDASMVKGKITITNSALSSGWVFPSDLQVHSINNVMASSIQAVSNLNS
jgi:hypothetical protein